MAERERAGGVTEDEREEEKLTTLLVDGVLVVILKSQKI